MEVNAKKCCIKRGIMQVSVEEDDIITQYIPPPLDVLQEQPSSPQKEGVKARSKATEEIQPAKKAFHTPQKSLPNQMDGDESKGSCSAPPSDASQQKQT